MILGRQEMLHSIIDKGEREIWKNCNILSYKWHMCAGAPRLCRHTKTFSDWLNYGGRAAAEVTRLGADIHSTTIPSAHKKRGGEMCTVAVIDNLN
jgi:hypothetical protein